MIPRRFATFFFFYFCTFCVVSSSSLLPFSSNPLSSVTELVDDEFIKTAYGDDKVWAVAFYKLEDKDIDDFAEVLEKVATQMKGLVEVGAIQVTSKVSWLMDTFKVKETPAVLAFPSRLTAKEKVPKPVQYQGSYNVTALSKWALKQLPSVLVGRAKSIQEMKQFRDSSIAYPAAVYYHNETDVVPYELRALSLHFSDGLLFCEVHVKSNKSLALASLHKIDVSNLPTWRVFAANSTHKDDAIAELSGTLSTADLQTALLPYVLSNDTREELRAVRHAEKEEEERKKKEKIEREKAAKEAKLKEEADEKKRKRREKRKIVRARDEVYLQREKVYEAMDGEAIQFRDDGWDVVNE